jgi:leader peptidase (prepilin peptidase) / N-methyltransferase
MFLRYLALFFAGACLGAVVNLGIYRLAYFRRRISPWNRTRELPLKRAWFDRLPILGWWSLRREEQIHGQGFWVRPMLLEIAFALGLISLYWWETQRIAVNVWLGRPNVRPGLGETAALHWQFAVHVGMITLMALATFIDVDEMTIPDAITVPGTIAALFVAFFCQSPVVPSLILDPGNPQTADLTTPLNFDYPEIAATFLTHWSSLAVALACFLVWCFALLPRHWRIGVSVGKAMRVMWRRIAVRPEWHWVLPIALLGCLGISAAWTRGGEPWRQVVSALLGLAMGGGMVWIIRVLGGALLQKEAMGFGDVTLLAMIGAFVGWQAAIIIFFLSPFVALIVAGIQRIVHGDGMIPYGPFLCLGTLTLLVFWAPLWNKLSQWFEVPWLVPSAIGICLPAVIVLLYLLRLWNDRRESIA